MTLDEVFTEFSDEMTQKNLYQRAMKSLAEKELKELTQYYQAHKDHPEILAHREFNNMIFFHSKDGSIHYYAQVLRSVQDLINSVVLHKNKQYQWLLAEAYEAFETFLVNLYACFGLADFNLWPMSDFGTISVNEIPSKAFDWYLQRAREKKGRPASILNQLRKLFPDICDVETDNYFKVNLKLSIVMIEMLRHVIVHRSGIVENKSMFVDNVLKKAGLDQNGHPRPEYVGFIESFFASGEFENHITLLEVRVEKDIPIDVHVDRFDLLTGHLMSYSYYLVERLKKHIQK